MDLIILHEGMYQLVAVTPELVAGQVWKDCFDLCDILREKIAVYNDEINKHVLKDGRFFFGCICN